MKRIFRDSDGTEVKEGDYIHFSYGIPPVGVRAPVIRRDGKLIAITNGHNPPECTLHYLKRHVGEFWVEKPKNPQGLSHARSQPDKLNGEENERMAADGHRAEGRRERRCG